MGGDYNFHAISAEDFEKLAITVVSEVHKIPYKSFGPGRDGGRDAVARRVNFDLGGGNVVSDKDVVVQVKHTTKVSANLDDGLRKKVFEDEKGKVEKLVRAKKLDIYVIITNYGLPAGQEDKLVNMFKGVGAWEVIVIGKETLSQLIDNRPKLKQGVLQLYGIYCGDPAQLLNIRNAKQCEEQLKDQESKNYIETKALKNAGDVLRKMGVVFVVGETGSGKTVILNQLALSLKDEYKPYKIISATAFEVLRDADQNMLFIVDDIFGKTSVEGLQMWLKLEDQVSTAKNNGARFVVSSRLQLFEEANCRNAEEAFIKRLKECCVNLNEKDHQLGRDEKIEMLKQHISKGDNLDSTKEALLKDDILSHAAEISCTCFPHAACQLGSADHIAQLKKYDVPLSSYDTNFLDDYFTMVQANCEQWKRKPKDFDVSKCQEDLRQRYLHSMTQVMVTPWSPSVTCHIDEVYMKLSWVKQTKTLSKTTEEPLQHYTDMFHPTQHHAGPLRILVQGEAGVGKSTFGQRLAIDWARRSMEKLKGFDLLLVIKLREVYSVTSFTEALCTCTESYKEAENLYQYVRQNQEKCLILLDGLDEYDTSQRNEILEIIEGQKLSKCCVILTTRPSVVERVQQYCNANCKILGFDEEGIKRYASKYFSNEEEVERFLDYLKKHYLFSLAEIPLLCLFLCLLWKDKRTEGLPTTRTALYEQIIQCIIDHSGSKSNPPTYVTLEEHDEALRKIGRVAYEALKKDSLVFDLRKLAEVKQSKEIMSLGLLSTTSALGRKPQNMVSFLHKTLQEFTAAWYVAKSLEGTDPAAYKLLKEDLKLVKATAKCEHLLFTFCHSKIMVHFLCGLSVQAACEIFKRLCVLKKSFNPKELVYFCDFLDLQNGNIYINCLAILGECRCNPDVSSLVVEFLDGCLAVNARDLSENTIELCESLLKCGLEKLLISLKYDFNKRQQSCLISLCQKLDLQLLAPAVNSGQCVGTSAEEFMSRLLKLPKKYERTVCLSKLEANFILEIYDFSKEMNTDRVIFVEEYPQGLRSLRVHNDIRTFGRVPFDKLVMIRVLEIVCTRLKMSDVRKLSSGLCNMKQLKKLMLCNTELTGCSVKTLCEHFKYVTQLQVLDLSFNREVGDEGVISVAEHLGDVQHLRYLNLDWISMTARGVTSLSAELHHIPHLKVLRLSSNQLGDGVVSLAGHLSSVPGLEMLWLQRTQMNCAGVRAIAAALCNVPLLTRLNLSINNWVDSDSWITLAGELHHLRRLKNFELYNCLKPGTAAEQSLKNAVPQECHLRLKKAVEEDEGGTTSGNGNSDDEDYP